ncbi:MAG: aquaporin [Acholeplasmatales bacterium]|jgi:aquaporin Z|nr:aquaporin [Acholeplasmatales bacterium]
MKKYVSECFGTLLLVFFGCGVALTTGDVIATSISFGLTLGVIIIVLGPVSGAHVNPAVSLAMAISGKLSWKDFILYVLSQLVGAFLGACLLLTITTDGIRNGILLGTNSSLHENVGEIINSVIVETILTFVFVSTILSITHNKKNSSIAPLVIGLVLLLVHLFGFNVTGTSVNPARSFGPALLAYFVNGSTVPLLVLPIFVGAPLLGGVLAALLYRFLGNRYLESDECCTYEEEEVSCPHCKHEENKDL